VKRRLRIYLDTSVFGGYFDPEFREVTRQLFQDILTEEYKVLVSTTTIEELDVAPDEVRGLLSSFSEDVIEFIQMSEEIIVLRDFYIEDGVVTANSLNDATHIAAASVARADLIVSWNFKHIVHFKRIRGYHAVNTREGYPQVQIHSPQEVIIR